MISLDYSQSWPFISVDLIAFRQPSISSRLIGIWTIKKCLLSHSLRSFIIYARRSLRQPTVDRALAIKITTFFNIDFYDENSDPKIVKKTFYHAGSGKFVLCLPRSLHSLPVPAAQWFIL